MFASSFLILFHLHLFHFTCSAHFLLFPLNSMLTFFPHYPLSFSFFSWFGKPHVFFWFSYLPPPPPPSLSLSFVIHYLFSLLISFLYTTLVLKVLLPYISSFLISTPLLRPHPATCFLCLQHCLFYTCTWISLYSFLKTLLLLRVGRMQCSYCLLFHTAELLGYCWSSTFLFKADCETFE